MEGRAIARPDAYESWRVQKRPVWLQWRAGQLPGRTRQCVAPGRHHDPASMEGRAIARPDWREREGLHAGWVRFNGGPGNCPAGPGAGRDVAGAVEASMEGRAIARPDRPGRGRADVGQRASMEGRAIARPDAASLTAARSAGTSLQWRAGQLPGRTGAGAGGSAVDCCASMEGRAIARPDDGLYTAADVTNTSLQWRAGQLPGRTAWRQRSIGDGADASMEGRAIARPDSVDAGLCAHVVRCFNGGPGNCPAGPRKSPCKATWSHCFNGGPGNCPAGRHNGNRHQAREHRASMEGRAIARPDRSLDLVPLRCPFAGTCERSGKR